MNSYIVIIITVEQNNYRLVIAAKNIRGAQIITRRIIKDNDYNIKIATICSTQKDNDGFFMQLDSICNLFNKDAKKWQLERK